jgi:hypothetical protein
LSDSGAYGVIRTSQNISGIKDSDNAVLILWNMNSMYFEINSTWYDGKVITKDNNVIQTFKFDHLSQIDIKLNKGNGEDRILSLTSEINNSSKGIFNVIDETSSYIQYSWKPDDKGGFITSTDKVRFEGVNSSGNKAVWVTDLVFHYTCQSIIA